MSVEEESGEDELGIKSGSVIESSKAKYVVIKLLGEGGFGAVYKVHMQSDPTKEYAIKIEKKMETRKHSKLKMEIAILKAVSALRGTRSHFTKIVDRGKKTDYYFVIMQLVGKSLADLKLAQKNKVFSIGTGLGVSMQCLEAIEDLHTQGFIHRDIKPANYACGLNAQKHVIYILDFGIARKIMKSGEDLKTPRELVGFKGTVRFASVACHNHQDMGMKDDCESWFYLFLDLVVVEGLPWKKLSEKNEVKESKLNCRKKDSVEYEHIFKDLGKCKEVLFEVFEYITKLAYHDIPEYELIYKLLKEAGVKEGVKVDDPYDWEQKEDKTKHHSVKAKV